MNRAESKQVADHLAIPIIGMVFKAGAEAGVDFRAVVRQLDLPYSADALSLGHPPQMPREHAVQLYHLSMVAICEQVGRQEGHPIISFEETQMMCRCIVNSRTLEEAIQLTQRFNAMLDSRRVELSLAVEQGVARFRMETFRQHPSRLTFLLDLFGLSFFQQLFSWLIGEDIALTEVSLAYPELAPQDLVAPLFGHPVRFGQSANSIAFAASLLRRPVLRNHDELIELQQLLPFEIMPSYLTSDSLAHRLGALMKASLIKNSAFPPLSRVAALLNQSSITLRRRLAAEGATVNEIKLKCRQELARDLLSHSHFSIDEISDRLGFSAPSAFRRAFRSWTGASASEYRAAHGERKKSVDSAPGRATPLATRRNA
jgi:AraC-like DNA-binding protein